MERFPMTLEGHQQAKDEVEHLKMVRRPAITYAIAEARAHGDLKENAEYHAARNEQGLTEARINYLEARLSAVQVIDVTKLEKTGRVVFGVTVGIYHVDTEKETTYKIVGEDEANIDIGKISVTSPIAHGLIGKMAGDEVDIKTPQGIATYEITKVEYI